MTAAFYSLGTGTFYFVCGRRQFALVPRADGRLQPTLNELRNPAGWIAAFDGAEGFVRLV